MESILKLKNIFGRIVSGGKEKTYTKTREAFTGTLDKADKNKSYKIKSIETNNDEMRDFLFTLGCYEGEEITLISAISNQYIVVIKDARYTIDKNLAASIVV